MRNTTRIKLAGIVLLVLAVGGVAGIAAAQTLNRGSDKFTDIPAGHWADEAVGWAVANGITTGTSDTTFSPNGTLTRAQMVTFLHRYHRNVAGGASTMPSSVRMFTGEGTKRVSTDGHIEAGIYDLRFNVDGDDRARIRVEIFDSDGSCVLAIDRVEYNWRGSASFVVGDSSYRECQPGTLWFQVTTIPRSAWTLSF